ncbi:hypothetical protein PIB30_075964, partial [Stylosanthes scabra]|nr:hypothetical protein [Stylosanthes scabra]
MKLYDHYKKFGLSPHFFIVTLLKRGKWCLLLRFYGVVVDQTYGYLLLATTNIRKTERKPSTSLTHSFDLQPPTSVASLSQTNLHQPPTTNHQPPTIQPRRSQTSINHQPPSRPLHHHRCPSAAAPSSLFFAGKQSPLQPPSVIVAPSIAAPSVGTPSLLETPHCCSEIQSSLQPPSIVGAPSAGVTSVTAPSSSRHPPHRALHRHATHRLPSSVTPSLPSSLSSSQNPSFRT